MDDFKQIVAENITKLRTSKGMTQAQLGEKLNYSDKSVSKWERGESIPDAYVLKNMAQLFGVSVDYLLTEHGDKEPISLKKMLHRYSRRMITMVALAGIFTLAVLAFVLVWMITGQIVWQIFVFSVPLALITLLVLNSVWGTPHSNLYIISGLLWGILTSVYLILVMAYHNDYSNFWQLFILGVPAQVVIVLSFSIKIRPKKEQ